MFPFFFRFNNAVFANNMLCLCICIHNLYYACIRIMHTFTLFVNACHSNTRPDIDTLNDVSRCIHVVFTSHLLRPDNDAKQ